MGQHGLAVETMQLQSARGLNLHALTNGFAGKILIAVNLKVQHFVPFALVNVEDDVGALARRICLFGEPYFGVKVAFGLEVIAYVTAAFREQIIVHRVLLVNRAVFLNKAFAYIFAFYFTVNARST